MKYSYLIGGFVISYLILIVSSNQNHVEVEKKITGAQAEGKLFHLLHHHKHHHKPGNQPPEETETSMEDLIPIGGKCYFLSCTNANFDGATTGCLNNNMRLASLLTKVDNDVVARYLNALGLSVSNTRIRASAHRDSCDPNTFIWEGVNKPMNYTNWAKGEPTNSGNVEDSLIIWIAKSGGIEWNDGRSDKEFPYLCEKSCTLP